MWTRLGPLLAAASAALAFSAVSAGQAIATEVQCGDVITHDTTLDADLTCPRSGFENVTGIVIGADNITLDLGGHVLNGPGVGFPDDNAIDNSGHHGVTVRNGAILNFRTSVRYLHSDGGAIENVVGVIKLVDANHVTVSGISDRPSASNIELDGSRFNVIKDNSFDGDISISASDRNRISHNSPSLGIVLSNGSTRNQIRDNTIADNDYSAGIDVSFSDHNSIVGNSVLRPYRGALGIRVTDSRATVVRDNSIEWQYFGIVLQRSQRSVVERNRVSGSGPYDTGDGFCQFCVTDSDGNRLTGNHAGGTPSYGVLVGGTSTGNRLIGNVASVAALGGIVIREDTRQSVLKRNVANENCFKYLGQCYRQADSQDGIHVETPSATLTKNIANDNLDLGINAVPGVIDGGGNRASGNGNPLQCLNVVCKPIGRRGP
jgi:large repetitive protein